MAEMQLENCRLPQSSAADWAASSYGSEIIQYLKDQESRQKISLRSPQLNQRSILISWIKRISESISLSRVTLHLGVFLLDKFMDNHNIEFCVLHACCLSCLILAAKFEELEAKVFALTDIRKWEGVTLPSKRKLSQLEAYILRSFQWTVSFQTAARFVDYYAALPNLISSSFQNYPQFLSSLYRFLDISLTKNQLLHFRPSQVAASCILAARVYHGIEPTWTISLGLITGYESYALMDPALILLGPEPPAPRRKRKLEESLDESGYESSSFGGKKTTKWNFLYSS